jgi:hypothetical protein
MALEEKETFAGESEMRNALLIKEALSHIEEGDRTTAVVRAALLLIKSGTGQRRLSAMKRVRELVGHEIGLADMPTDVARKIIREQSYIVEFEPVKALEALPQLLRMPGDRRFLLDLLDRVEDRIGANTAQSALLGDIRRLLSKQRADGEEKEGQIAVTLTKDQARVRPDGVARHGSPRHGRRHRRTRASS